MMKRTMQRGMFAAAMAAALGFGGAQAFASPGAAAKAARACNTVQCRIDCQAIGYEDGRCNQGSCVCFFVAPPAR
jgi:hypothetical protein